MLFNSNSTYKFSIYRGRPAVHAGPAPFSAPGLIHIYYNNNNSIYSNKYNENGTRMKWDSYPVRQVIRAAPM